MDRQHVESDPTAAADRPADRVATILRDITCPGCEYNLRGLHGPIVDCPECGRRCDAPKMVAARWTGPWWKAPQFNTVLMPSTWAVLSYLGVGVMFALDLGPMALAIRGAAFMAALAVWAVLMGMAWRLFAGPWGLALALLAHVLIAGYLTGVLGVVITVTVSVLNARDGDHLSLLFLLPLTAVFAGVIGLCRLGERFIAGQCIKRHLARLRGEAGPGIDARG